MNSFTKLDEVIPFLLSGRELTLQASIDFVREMPQPIEILDTLRSRFKEVAKNDLSNYNEMLILEKIIQICRQPMLWTNDNKKKALIKACQQRLIKLYET